MPNCLIQFSNFFDLYVTAMRRVEKRGDAFAVDVCRRSDACRRMKGGIHGKKRFFVIKMRYLGGWAEIPGE